MTHASPCVSKAETAASKTASKATTTFSSPIDKFSFLHKITKLNDICTVRDECFIQIHCFRSRLNFLAGVLKNFFRLQEKTTEVDPEKQSIITFVHTLQSFGTQIKFIFVQN